MKMDFESETCIGWYKDEYYIKVVNNAFVGLLFILTYCNISLSCMAYGKSDDSDVSCIKDPPNLIRI
jgi:hypothetical protein